MSETRFKLISFSICPFVQRPRIVMFEKQIAHTIEYIDLQDPPMWFHEVSPLEKVPVLLVDEQALFESMPICEYLDEVSPGSLYPEAPLDRARQRAWLDASTSSDELAYGSKKATSKPGVSRYHK